MSTLRIMIACFGCFTNEFKELIPCAVMSSIKTKPMFTNAFIIHIIRLTSLDKGTQPFVVCDG